mmetsp:Transcript_7712/g.14830  ORF Transcript_7712/g.14830 Transcript_7712/m.14830 type:complete len:355 (+) Transcript_7712:1354-2418(+)
MGVYHQQTRERQASLDLVDACLLRPEGTAQVRFDEENVACACQSLALPRDGFPHGVLELLVALQPVELPHRRFARVAHEHVPERPRRERIPCHTGPSEVYDPASIQGGGQRRLEHRRLDGRRVLGRVFLRALVFRFRGHGVVALAAGEIARPGGYPRAFGGRHQPGRGHVRAARFPGHCRYCPPDSPLAYGAGRLLFRDDSWIRLFRLRSRGVCSWRALGMRPPPRRARRLRLRLRLRVLGVGRHTLGERAVRRSKLRLCRGYDRLLLLQGCFLNVVALVLLLAFDLGTGFLQLGPGGSLRVLLLVNVARLVVDVLLVFDVVPHPHFFRLDDGLRRYQRTLRRELVVLMLALSF